MIIDLPVVLECPLSREGNPLQWLGPVPGNPVALRQFTRLEDWREYAVSLSPRGEPPEVIALGYSRTLRVLYLAWLDASVIKLAELAALATLESAIVIRYQRRFKGLEAALKYLVEHAGVTDADLRVVRECGGSVVANLLKASTGGPALSEVRNQLAHGDPFETSPRAGLFEVVRDLTDFMYPPATHSSEI